MHFIFSFQLIDEGGKIDLLIDWQMQGVSLGTTEKQNMNQWVREIFMINFFFRFTAFLKAIVIIWSKMHL